MVKMTEEQKAQRMAARRRAEAEAEEAGELRREAKRREWVEKSMYLTYDEMMAGMPCRGCGEILWDGKGKPFVPINNRTEEDQREIDEAEAKFQELHPDCHEGSWSMQASSTLHCHLCCPSSPMSPTQREKIRNLFSVTVSPRSLNRWNSRSPVITSWRRQPTRTAPIPSATPGAATSVAGREASSVGACLAQRRCPRSPARSH
jgi:hypothetical protein